MAQNNMVRLPSGHEYDIDRFGDYPLYSEGARFFNGQATMIYVFNYVVGSQNPGTAAVATKLDTNLDKVMGGLGYTEEMLVHAVAIQLPHEPPIDSGDPDIGLLEDMIDLIDETYFKLTVNEKIYTEGLIDSYPFFGGLYVETTLNNAEYVNNGMPMSGACRALGLPIHLTGKSHFQGIFDFPRAALSLPNTNTDVNNFYRLRVWLLGIRSRFEGTTVSG